MQTIDTKEGDSSSVEGASSPNPPSTPVPENKPTRAVQMPDDSGYHTPYDQERKIVASPSSPFEEGYSEEMVLSDEDLGDLLEDDDDDDDDDNFHLRPVDVEAEENDADDESEVDRTENKNSLASSAISPPSLDPASPRTRSLRRSLGARKSSTSGVIRYIRSKVGNSRINSESGGEEGERPATPDQMDVGADDSSTSEDSYDNESTDSSWDTGGVGHGFGRMDSNELIAWDDLPPVPQHYLGDQDCAPLYLDATLVERQNEISEMEANRFVAEQSLFLRAVLQLLGERDQVGVEGSMDSSDNIWKQGPLKKMSSRAGRRRSRPTSKWKFKYVELRKGNMCYYEDSGTSGGRKTVHLRQSDTVVREIVSKASGFVFEVAVEGYPSQFWMASSEEERQGWIKAIQTSMIGETDLHRELDLRPHQDGLDVFLKCRSSTSSASEVSDYLHNVRDILSSGVELRVPMKWVRDEFRATEPEDTVAAGKEPKSRLAPHRLLKTSINQFWMNLSDTSFSINGSVIQSDGPMSAERTLGGLTRCILEYDKAFVISEDEERGNLISELQAVSYARDILMSSLRSRELNELFYAVSNLVQNDKLVRVEVQREEPAHIEVSWAGEDLVEESATPVAATSSDLSGWLRTKAKKTGGAKYRKRFVVLSGSVLSYYEAALPRPHGLQGQVVFESTSTVDREGDDEDKYVLCLIADEKRLLAFDSEEELNEWRDAIQSAVDICIPSLATTPSGSRGKSLLKGAERVIKGAIPGDSIRGGIRVIKGATDGGIKVIRSAKDGGIKVIRGGIRGARGILRPSRQSDEAARQRRYDLKRRPSMQMLMNSSQPDRKDPTVQCVVQATQTFDVVSIESGEILFSVRTKLFQAFLLSGGVNGDIARGNAIIELEVGGSRLESREEA